MKILSLENCTTTTASVTINSNCSSNNNKKKNNRKKTIRKSQEAEQPAKDLKKQYNKQDQEKQEWEKTKRYAYNYYQIPKHRLPMLPRKGDCSQSKTAPQCQKYNISTAHFHFNLPHRKKESSKQLKSSSAPRQLIPVLKSFLLNFLIRPRSTGNCSSTQDAWSKTKASRELFLKFASSTWV